MTKISFKEYKCSTHGYVKTETCLDCKKVLEEYLEDSKTGYWIKYAKESISL